MYRHLFKKNNISGRALLLLGVYLLHFALMQVAVVGFSNSNHLGLKSFFSCPKKDPNPNSGIATFRILEKHKAAQQTFRISHDISAFDSKLFSTVTFLDKTDLSPGSFHRSDASYKLYVWDCVFLI